MSLRPLAQEFDPGLAATLVPANETPQRREAGEQQGCILQEHLCSTLA